MMNTDVHGAPPVHPLSSVEVSWALAPICFHNKAAWTLHAACSVHVIYSRSSGSYTAERPRRPTCIGCTVSLMPCDDREPEVKLAAIGYWQAPARSSYPPHRSLCSAMHRLLYPAMQRMPAARLRNCLSLPPLDWFTIQCYLRPANADSKIYIGPCGSLLRQGCKPYELPIILGV
ncbi:uncharacterized protein SCHCODRAFT_02634795 [Schizophyllum commune H4-8]|uniref:uncharacterized protein n=1 Tax=Schizophyllum commune (strain H4-8 / FGSC 9210) TaxID=578458 RepID=UPI00215E02D3|nr:uncharacterized protein SCHCODRAFT_02634795 [Schizophyllum commune H4-8]KAI5889524.1 hypothetical protein SCHCODRAFT_02634795 [Schizophyllum commune H4-8]